MRYRSIFLLAALLPVLFQACAGEAEKAEPAPKGVVAIYVGAGMGDLNPGAAVWQGAAEMTVPMLAQDLTDPKLAKATLPEIRVRALFDDRRVAFRIEWADPTQDTVDSEDRFSDAVAVQLPPTPGGHVPDPTMGQADKPVHIHLWKASYEGAQDPDSWSLRQTFPYAIVDHYPFEAASPDEVENLKEQYTIALAAGNPLIRVREGSVDDLIAHGFGTLSYLPRQASSGWSRWEHGRWAVVISRPLSQPEWPGGDGFKPGENTFAAFAVWDGGRKERGSRKVRSVWVPLDLGGSS